MKTSFFNRRLSDYPIIDLMNRFKFAGECLLS